MWPVLAMLAMSEFLLHLMWYVDDSTVMTRADGRNKDWNGLCKQHQTKFWFNVGALNLKATKVSRENTLHFQKTIEYS